MTEQLKGGQTTEDRRLDRVIHFDERSRDYPIRALIGGVAAPRSYTWAGGPVTDQGREGACFPAGAFVRLANGSQRKIEDIRLLDEVVTAEGRTGTVTQTMVRQANRGLVEVAFEGHLPLRCTPEHPVLTARGYVAAGSLLVGDEVAITRYVPDCDEPISVLDLVDVADLRGVISGTVNTGGVLTEVAPLPTLLGRTPALGRLLGLYAAEGHTTANKVTWSYGGHEEDTLVAETVALVKSVFDASARVQRRPNGALSVVLYGKTWRRLFEALVPGTSKHGDKHLSVHVTAGPTVYRQALLQGWLDGDGHKHPRGYTVGVTVCRRLALDMHALATGLGMRPALRMSAPSMNRHAATRQTRYDMTLGSAQGGNRSARQDEHAVWRKVQSVQTDGFTGWVYNIEVEGDHSYLADGVGVHNCVGHGWTGELTARPQPWLPPNDPSQYAYGLYKEAQTRDPWPGEDYSGTSVLAAAQVLQERGLCREFRWAFGIDDLILAVGYKGPAVLGIPWYDSMYSAPNGTVTVSGRLVGGHCILARGVSVKKKTVLLRNSWGADWGNGGDAVISFADLDRLLREGGEACIPVRRAR